MTAPQLTMQKPLPSLDYGVGAGVALLLAGLIGFGLAKAGSVPLHLQLYGDLGPVSPDAVAQMASPLLSRGFFQLDSDELEERVARLPWVQSVQVERLWPDRVAVHITSHEALARWGQYAVLTDDGDLIVPDPLPSLGLKIEAPEAKREAVFADLNTILPRLPKEWELRRWQVSSTGDRQAQIELDDGLIVLEFGREPVAEKFQLLADVVLPVLKPRLAEVAAVDLRYRNGFAVRWKAGVDAGNEE